VLIPSPFNRRRDWRRLAYAIENMPVNEPVMTEETPLPLPVAAMTPGEALNTPAEIIKTADSEGRIAAANVCPCPPGTPIVLPGEIVSTDAVEAMKRHGIESVCVVKSRK